MSSLEISDLARALISVAQSAGRAEMDVYGREIAVQTKKDNSPVTEADQAAETIILDALETIAPGIPIIAEEAFSAGQVPEIDDLFFLVDPLDGTKEFIKKSHEFTVNIALIEKAEPVFGLVYAPALKALYLTTDRNRAELAHLDPYGTPVTIDDLQFKTISTRKTPENGPAIIASKSHMTDATQNFIARFNVSDQISAGSSLKFCLLAMGDADIYPRFGPTMEWDTAAGHAVLNAAGGVVLREDGSAFTYGHADRGFLNPFFIAWGDREFASN